MNLHINTCIHGETETGDLVHKIFMTLGLVINRVVITQELCGQPNHLASNYDCDHFR